jgi:hypothetical protein
VYTYLRLAHHHISNPGIIARKLRVA